MTIKTILTTLTAVMLITILATAEIPQMINYQGNLTTSDGTPSEGVFFIKFVIYDAATGGTEIWNSTIQEVTVTNGLFEVMLGADPMPALPDDLFSTDTTRYLGIKVGSDLEISPRIRFTSVACAYQSLRSDSAGYATTANLANTATVASSVVADAIGSTEIANGSITDVDIHSSAAIATSKISGTAVNLNDAQTITGTKTFNDLKVSTTTRRLALSAAAFIPGSNNSDVSLFGYGAWYINTYNQSAYFYANISLPDGAVITQLEGNFYDAETSNDWTMELKRVNDITAAVNVLALLTSSGSSGMSTGTDNSIMYSGVDNENYRYFIVTSGFWSNDLFNMALVGAEVEYTITTPLP